MWKNFKEGKVWDYQKKTTKNITFFSIFKRFVVLACILSVCYAWKFIIQYGKEKIWSLWENTVKTVSKQLWKEMIRDEYWNVNILVVWIGWEQHQWWYLADTMIVASWKPESWAVTMLSVPRDLYVAWSWYSGRINWIFARWVSKWWTIWSWAEMLIEKMEQMLSIKISYYVVADFQWFKDIIDTLWWIDIYVPQAITDNTYPDSWIWYEPFHIDQWQHHLDGTTALKYARSRHTTSDFSRSQRQQEIIKAVIHTALQKENLTSVNKLTELYDTYTKMITTNISSKEIIWMVKYIYEFKNIFSFGLNTYCTYSSYRVTDAWCFLYNWNREAFNWAAVMIPNWATAWNVSYYEYIQNFASFIFHNQWYLLEKPEILVKNAIDKSYASQHWKTPTWWANKIAVKMKKYWFNLVWAENSDEILDQTTVIVYWNDYPETIKILQKFMPINVIKKWQAVEWLTMDGPNLVYPEQEQLWYDMELYLWNDFIDYIVENPFSYER